MNTVLKAGEAVYGGYTLARDGGVVFITGAIPGEVVEVSVREKKRDYSVAAVTGVVEPSDFRVAPRCGHFDECGGCQLQFIDYEKQIEMKNRVLLDCLRRIGGIEAELLPPLTGGGFGYRRRAQFKISKDGRWGFYREGTRDVVPVESCPLMVDEINGVLLKTAGAGFAGVREVHVTSGDALLALVKGPGFDEHVAGAFEEMGFAGVAFEDGSHRGRGFTTLGLGGLQYTVSPWSFFQSNWELNSRLAALIAEGLGPLDGMRVLDLYAGAGNFSLLLAAAKALVVAVEENPYSIKDGERNVSLSGISGFRFVRGRAEDAKYGKDFQVVLLDPPRPGITRKAMDRVLEILPERIVYVSCNPSTFARDLKKLREHYEVDSIRMADLFPHTYHVEALAFLRRKAGS